MKKKVSFGLSKLIRNVSLLTLGNAQRSHSLSGVFQIHPYAHFLNHFLSTTHPV